MGIQTEQFHTIFKNCYVVKRMSSSGMYLRVGLLGTDVSEEHIASVFRLKTTDELKHVSNSYRL
jgi:hypothetical protein